MENLGNNFDYENPGKAVKVDINKGERDMVIEPIRPREVDLSAIGVYSGSRGIKK